ncbi:MAG: hypothetical protein IJX72_01925 [Clostridia bacterium]|nr:hypothetical protein [Clostridia bacterium]
MNNYMNDNKKRPVSASAVTRIVIWSVVLCILVGLFALGMIFGSKGTFARINLGGYRYDDSGFSVGNGTSNEQITDISVDWIAGSVTVVAAEGDEISVSEDYRGEDQNLALRWKITDGRLTVKYRAPAWLANPSVDKNLTIAIPASMMGSLGDVEIDGVDCDVDFNGNADELSLDVVDGDLTVRGDIGELDVDAVDGNVIFRGGVRKADVDCVDATVVMYLDMAAELNFDQVDGDVTLYLSDGISGFSAEIDSVGGGIEIEGFDSVTTQGRKSARWGDGSLRICVDGVGAQLKIEKETDG